MRLNGWLRLWVVLTILWTLFTAGQAWLNRPAPRRVSMINGQIVSEDRAEDELRQEWRTFATVGLVFWLVPPVTLYAAGIAIRWISRGFDRQ